MSDSKILLLLDIDGTIINNTNPFYIFKDSLSAIKQLSTKVDLGIFSQGWLPTKLVKLAMHRVLNFFPRENFYVSFNKLDLAEEIIKQHPREKIYIVDNLPEIINGLKPYKIINSILINRDPNTVITDGINSFTELIEYKF